MSGKDPLPREQAYEGVRAVNPPDIISSVRNPTTNDKKYPLGTMWMNTVTQVSYQLVSSPGIWAILGGAAGGDLQTLTTSDATVVMPALGNINVTQGTNILTTGAGSSVTVATVASPTFTDLNMSGDLTLTGGNLVATLGDITATAGVVTAGAGLTVTGGGATIAGGATISTGDFTVTAGDITTTNGDVIVGGAGSQLALTGAASQVLMHGGAATDFIGSGTLALGTATILNTNIAATDRIFFSRIGINGSAALGDYTYVINAGVSFVITSVQPAAPAVTEAGDVSTFTYVIIRQTA